MSTPRRRTSLTGMTKDAAFADGAKLFLESVDCEVCGRHLAPHLMDMPTGEPIGLCNLHLGDYHRLYHEELRSVRTPSYPPHTATEGTQANQT